MLDCPSMVFAAIHLKNYPAFPALSCADFQDAAEGQFRKVQALYGRPLPAPQIVVLNDEYAGGGEYGWRSNELDIKITASSRSEIWQADLAHELGHVIFAQFMKSKIPDLFALPDVAAYNRVQSAHNELFADVVAALLYDDTEVMVWATAAPGFDNLFLSFSRDTELSDQIARDDHGRLAPLRKRLWDQWISPRRNNPSALLSEMASIMIDDGYGHYRDDFKLAAYDRAVEEIRRLTETFALK